MGDNKKKPSISKEKQRFALANFKHKLEQNWFERDVAQRLYYIYFIRTIYYELKQNVDFSYIHIPILIKSTIYHMYDVTTIFFYILLQIV